MVNSGIDWFPVQSVVSGERLIACLIPFLLLLSLWLWRFTSDPESVTQQSRPRAKRSPGIQGLRGLAMSLVALGHFGLLLQTFVEPSHFIRQFVYTLINGQYGSGLFLLISGYSVYARCDTESFCWRSFLRTRAVRLLPLYWFVLGLYAAVDWASGFPGRLPADPWTAIAALLQNALLLAPLSGEPLFVTVAWTLTHIAIGYITIPALAGFFRRRGLSTAQRIAILCVAAACWVAAPLVFRGLGGNGVGLPLGMLVFEFSRCRFAKRFRPADFDIMAAISVPSALFLLIASSSGAVSQPWASCLRLTAVIGPLALLLAGRLVEGGIFNRILCSPVAQWMGKISYSYYFAQGFGLLVTRVAIKATQPWWAGRMGGAELFAVSLLLFVVLSVAAGAATYYCLERPLIALFSRVPQSRPRLQLQLPIGQLQFPPERYELRSGHRRGDQPVQALPFLG